MNKLGVKISDKRLNNLFLNPIYCGLIVSIMVPGKLIPGKHEPLISTELFFVVHIIRLEKSVGGFVHDNYKLPLKIFTKCDNCMQTMTGYLIKKKNLYYYNCRTKGCKVNRSATAMRDLFRNVLKTFQIGNQEVTIIKVQLEEQMAGFFKSEMEQNKFLFLPNP